MRRIHVRRPVSERLKVDVKGFMTYAGLPGQALRLQLSEAIPLALMYLYCRRTRASAGRSRTLAGGAANVGSSTPAWRLPRSNESRPESGGHRVVLPGALATTATPCGVAAPGSGSFSALARGLGRTSKGLS